VELRTTKKFAVQLVKILVSIHARSKPERGHARVREGSFTRHPAFVDEGPIDPGTLKIVSLEVVPQFVVADILNEGSLSSFLRRKGGGGIQQRRKRRKKTEKKKTKEKAKAKQQTNANEHLYPGQWRKRAKLQEDLK